jgi:outer membrane protein assembly factor BamA
MRLGRLLATLLAVVALAALAALPAFADEVDPIPRYLIQRVDVRGNRRTAAAVVRGAILIRAGESLSADDPRLEASRFRLLGLGLFNDVHLRLERGRARGSAVLVVEVVERGTLVLNNLWFGNSRAVAGWGGVDLAETNFAGQGMTLGGAALASSAPDMPGARPQLALRLRFVDGRIGRTPLSFSGGFMYNDVSEPYRIAGDDADGRPGNFAAVRYRRVGGVLGAGVELAAFARIRVEYRLERVEADVPHPFVRTLPSGDMQPIDPGLRDRGSFLSTISFSFERDTRADPVLTPSGSRLVVGNELASRALGGGYDFYKLTAQYQHWVRLRRGHVLSFGVLAGVIVGDAPIFERYYLGDIDPLVPPRALGMTVSTLPARNLLGTGIARERYAPLAGRVMFEYAVPLFRGGRVIYGGDVFVQVGLVGLAQYDDLRSRAGGLWQSLPIDLYVDSGVRLDTLIGSFNLTLGNGLGRVPF